MGKRWDVPKVSVYLPDELYREARMRQLPLSSLVQEAVERALRNSNRQEWVLRSGPAPGVTRGSSTLLCCSAPCEMGSADDRAGRLRALTDAVLDQPAAEWVLEQIAGEEVAAP